MTTTNQLAAIEARAEAATPGPWVEFHENGTPGELEAYNCPPATGAFLIDYADWDQKQKDANFIAHARADIPALLAMVREQQARLDKVAALVSEAFAGDLYMLPGGYPSRPVEAFDLRAALTATGATE